MSEASLRRYTNLPATLHILQNKCLTFLSPDSWDDRNDAHFVAEYQARTKAKTLLALCFAEANETYHHWSVFAGGSDGVCIEFNKDMLHELVKNDDRYIYDLVKYPTINKAKKTRFRVAELPFVKRFAYKDEIEYRMLFVDKDEAKENHRLKISLDIIDKVILSPWMPRTLVSAVTATLKNINGCSEMPIKRSTLIENEIWKRTAKRKRI